MANKEIGTKIKLEGEKEFNAQMTAINSGLKTTKSEMALVSSAFADNAGSVDALTAKQKVLQSSVEQHQKKVDALRAQYEKASATLGENEARTQKYKQQLNYATVELTKSKAALEENNQKLTDSKSRLKNVISGYKDMVYKLADAKDGLDEFNEKQKKAGELLKMASAPATAFAKGVGAVTTAAVAGTAALAAVGTAALTTMAGYAREAADAAKQASEAGEELTATQQKWLEYSTQLDALDASVANAKSALGGVLLPVLGDLSTEGAAFLNDFTRDMEAAAGDTEKQGQVMSEYIVKGANLIKQKLPEYIKVGKELLGGLGSGLLEAAPELLDIGGELVMDLLNAIIEFAPQLAESGLALIEQLMQGLIDGGGENLVTSAADMITQLVTGLAQAAPKLIPMAAQLVVQLATALIQAAPDLLLAGLELIYGIITGIASGIGNIVNSAGEIIESIKTAFGDKVDDFLAIGGDIVTGIWNGISSGYQWLCDKITEWTGNVVNWIKEKLGIKSPSRVMRDEVGIWMARGIGTGFMNEMALVNKQIADTIDTSFDIPEYSFRHNSYIGRNYRTPAGKTVNLYFYAKTITESDINLVVDVVNRKLGEAM